MASGGATLFLCALVFLVSAARPARSCLEIFQASCTKPDAEPKDWVHCGGHLFRCDSYRMEIKFGGKDPTYMARKDPLDDLMLEMEDPVLSPIFADTDCDFLCSFSDSLPLFAPLPAPTPQRSSLLRSHCDKSNYSNLVSELIVGYQQYRPCSTYYLYFKSQRQHEYEEYPRLRATHRLSEPAATSPLLTWKLSMEYNTNSTMFNIVSVGFSRRGHQLDATSRFGCHMRGGSCFSPSTPSYTSCDGGMERIAIIVGLIFFGAYLTCGMLSGGWIWRKCEVDMKDCDQEQLLLREIGKNGAATYTFVDVNKGGGKRGPEICVYSFSNVLAGTDNFSDDKKLGQGGFGAVYKGKLSDGQEIAIKRLSIQSAQGLQEFKTEILIVARLQHKNLVRLLGCCIHKKERLLIYEYMPNKSLDFLLFDPERAAQLDWSKRAQIMEGIAQGLLYLHKYSRLTIIHRDLKASNILLDSEMNPKISDFGMARIFSSNEDKANTNRIVGTYGYMSPEYAMAGRFSVKSDVFSFGVLILEIVSGMKNIGSHHYFPVHGNLLGYAWELRNAGKELELVDPSLGGSWRGREVSRCVYVGLMCVQDCADDRPTMAEVVGMLAGEIPAHQVPKQPAFFPKRDAPGAGGLDPAAVCSINSMTMSTMEGR